MLYRESTPSATIATAQPWIHQQHPPSQMTGAQAVNYTSQQYLVGNNGLNPIDQQHEPSSNSTRSGLQLPPHAPC